MGNRGRSFLEGWLARRRESARTVLRLLSLLRLAGPGVTAALLTVRLVGALLPLALIVLSGVLIVRVQDAIRFGGAPQTSAVLQVLIVLGGVFAVERLVDAFNEPLKQLAQNRIDAHFRRWVRAAALRPHGIAHLESSDFQDTYDSVQRGFSVSGGTMALLEHGAAYLTLAGSIVILCTLSPLLTVALVIAVLGGRELYRIGFSRLVTAWIDQSFWFRRRWYVRSIATGLESAKELRLFQFIPWILERYREYWDLSYGPARVARARLIRTMSLTSVGMLVVYAGAATVIGYAAARHRISVGALFVYLQAAIAIAGMAGLDAAAIGIEQAVQQFAKLDELDERTRSEGWSGSLMPPSDLPAQEISFEDVTFGYPARDQPVLRNLSLSIPLGGSLALVGENGAGKSTLVKLLAGLYRPQSGRILADGIDVSDFDPDEWQRRVAVVFQDFAHLPGTVGDNVGFGAPELMESVELLDAAGRRAGAADLVGELASGWDTFIGRGFTGGVDLSGGQWQRVALARALFALQGKAKLLILDEPTASMDVRGEAEFFDRFLEITSGVTTILVSHRFSTVRRADRIVVIKDCAIVEDGSHEQLMELGGIYAEMFTLQASHFADEEQAEEVGADA